MIHSISELVSQLEVGALSVESILSFRRNLGMPFRLHPLGFLSCTLLIEESRRVRLHYWPISGGREQSSTLQIHDHLFEFKSWVLQGTVQNREYIKCEGGIELARYETEYRGELSILRKTSERERLVVKKTETHNVGNCYSVAAGVLHETLRIGSSAALTILVATDIVKKAAIVYGPPEGEDRYEYVRSVVDESKIEEFLSASFVSRQ